MMEQQDMQQQQQQCNVVYTETFTPFDRLRLLCMISGTKKEILEAVGHGAEIAMKDIHGVLLTTICKRNKSVEALRVLEELGAPFEEEDE
jgi:hypothetical protein